MQQLLIQTFKCLKQIAPDYISSKFTFNYSIFSQNVPLASLIIHNGLQKTIWQENFLL